MSTSQNSTNAAAAAAALEAFISRQNTDATAATHYSRSSVVDDFSKTSTGYLTPACANRTVSGPFWSPPSTPEEKPKPVQPERQMPVSVLGLSDLVKNKVCILVKKPVSAMKFCSMLSSLGFPISVVMFLLTKMELTTLKNRNDMVNIQEMNQKVDDFVNSLVQMKESPSKRGREQEQHPDAPSTNPQETSIIHLILEQLRIALLSTVDGGEVSLDELFQSGFLHLNPSLMRQVMAFLADDDNMWCLHRILMEMPGLNVDIRGTDYVLSLGQTFKFCSFDRTTTSALFKGFHDELKMMHQICYQLCRQKEIEDAKEKDRQNRFNGALNFLWKTGDFSAFFEVLVDVCPEFNSFRTNWELLTYRVVYDFMKVYNAATRRTCRDNQLCDYPIKEFIAYATKCGVFERTIPLCRYNVRMCHQTISECRRSGCPKAHQDYLSRGWTSSFYASCCSNYANRGWCHDNECPLAHVNVVEFNRALYSGAGDSNAEWSARVEKRRKTAK
jgi:hypothetical protein